MSDLKLNGLNSLVGTLEAPGVLKSDGRRVYFVRHGVTEWNREFRYQGVSNIPLSEEGEVQATLTGLRFAFLGESNVKIVTSPLLRAITTASLIEKKLSNTDFEVWEDLKEIDFGEWEGLTGAEIVKKYGYEFFNRWMNAQLDVEVPGGEKCDSVFNRARKVADKILNSSEKNLIVVGHGALLRTLFVPMLNQPKSNVFWKMRLDNCSVSGMSITENKKATILFYNDIMHLKVKDNVVSKLTLL
jgi:alpha-ribazole phosphatase/probable phosphoglycerate mutase